MSATGNWGSYSGDCNIATVGSDLILTCLGSGNFQIANGFITGGSHMEVGAGGGSGQAYEGRNGGGGAGEVSIVRDIAQFASTPYAIVVGVAGTRGAWQVSGTNGGNTSAFGITVNGGGYGGMAYNQRGNNGGSGGGDSDGQQGYSSSVIASVGGRGNRGGIGQNNNGYNPAYQGGGGGGAGGVGGNSTPNNASTNVGGAPVYESITGTSTPYGAGGNGGACNQGPRASAYGKGMDANGGNAQNGCVIIRIINGANPTSIPTVAPSKTNIGGTDYNSFDAVGGTQRVLTVNTNRNSTSYTHDLFLQDAGGNDLFTIGTNVASSISINLTEAQQEFIVNSIGANTGTPNWRTLKSANFRVRMYNNQLAQNTYSAVFAYNYLPSSITKDRTTISQLNKTVTLSGVGDGIADTNIQVQLRDNTTVLDQAGRKNSNSAFTQALSLTDGQIATIEESIPNTPNKTLNLYYYMQVDDTVYKTYQEDITYTCDNSTSLYSPDVGVFDLEDTTMDGVAGSDYLIAGLSNVSAVISDLGTGKRYATISANWVSGDSKNTGEKTEIGTYEVGLVTPNLNYQDEPLNLNYTLSTRDSRGFISTDIITKQIIPYKQQSQNFSYSRENDFGDITTINLDGFYTKITDAYGGTGLNFNPKPVLTYRWKKINDENWSEPLTGTIVDGELVNFKQAYTSEFAINLDLNFQWLVEVTIEDDVQSVSWVWEVDSGKSLFQIRADGTGAGVSRGGIFTYGKLEHGLGFDSFQSEEFTVANTPFKVFLGSFSRYGKIEVEINTGSEQFLGEIIYSAQGMKQNFISQGGSLKFWIGAGGLYVGTNYNVNAVRQFNLTVHHDGCFDSLEMGSVSFSTTPADFTAIPSINFGNASELVTQATFIYDATHINAYTGSLPDPILAYKTGMKIDLLVVNSNTGAVTLNIDGLGVKSVKKNGSEALVANDITAGKIIPLAYDGLNFQVIGGGSSSVASNSFVSNEIPSGTVNGTNATFTLANTPVSGTLALYRDGQLMKGGGNDYTLTGNSIVFVTAPLTDSVLLAFYQQTVNTSGNADTLDGFHANSTPTAGNIPVLDTNGLLPFGALGSAWQSWTPTLGGITIGNGTVVAKYCVIGKTLLFHVHIILGSTSVITGRITVSLPVAPTNGYVCCNGYIDDYGANNYGLIPKAVGSTIYCDVAKSNNTYVDIAYISSTVPMTWVTNDGIFIDGFYQIT